MRGTAVMTAGRMTVHELHGEKPGGGRRSASTEALLSPRQVAERVALSENAVRGAVARGELRAAKLCRRIRIAEADLEAWIFSALVQPDERPLAPPPPKTRAAGVFRALLDDGRT